MKRVAADEAHPPSASSWGMAARRKPRSTRGTGGRWREKASSTQPRSWDNAAVPLHLCVACGGTSGRLAKCCACDGEYHLRCLDPPRKQMPGKGWVCGVCNTSGSSTGTPASSAGFPPCATPHTASMAHPHSAMLVSSVLARLSGDSTVGRSLASCSPMVTSTVATRGPFDCRESGMRNVTDAVAAWAFRSVGVGGLEDPSSDARPTQTSSVKANQDTHQRRSCDSHHTASCDSRRSAGHISGGSVARRGSLTPRCYCGNTDVTKTTVRCVSCASVFHPTCMDPPYPTVQSIPSSGYTCLACRPTCAACGLGFLPEAPASVNITCAACELVFHRACVTSPVSGPQDRWKCPECVPSSPYSVHTNGELGTAMEERQVSAPGFSFSKTSSGSFTSRPCSTARTPASTVKQRACVVCGVAEGKKMNVCGSCGDAYHSLCLDRPRTRRAGDSWRCDSCRPSSPVAEGAPVLVWTCPPAPPTAPTALSASHPVVVSLAASGKLPSTARKDANSSTGKRPKRNSGVAGLEAGVDSEVCETVSSSETPIPHFWTGDEHNRFLKVRWSAVLRSFFHTIVDISFDRGGRQYGNRCGTTVALDDDSFVDSAAKPCERRSTGTKAAGLHLLDASTYLHSAFRTFAFALCPLACLKAPHTISATVK